MFFVGGKFTSVYLWLFALLRLGWGQDIAGISQVKNNIATNWSPFFPSTDTLASSRLPRASIDVAKPVCGRTMDQSAQPLILNGITPQIGEVPWHANIYIDEKMAGKDSEKKYICGATMIQDNLLLTAAHCIYDEATETTTDPRKLFVMMGSIFRDYDSPLHNPSIVKKGTVKNVYTNYQYYGLKGNYASDIAVLELQEPFPLSETILPACLGLDSDESQILEAGVYGRIAGFGSSESGTSSKILQINTVPYITYSKCKGSADPVFLSRDKFCTGNSNVSTACSGDSGSGLVFKKNDLWYATGILSIGLGLELDHDIDGETTCDRYSTLLHTRVSSHMGWIQKIMFDLKQH